jgi:hypothetical protein
MAEEELRGRLQGMLDNVKRKSVEFNLRKDKLLKAMEIAKCQIIEFETQIQNALRQSHPTGAEAAHCILHRKHKRCLVAAMSTPAINSNSRG